MTGSNLVLVFPIVGNEVLLSIRKKAPWVGCLSGLGGGFIEEDCYFLNTVRREAVEEAVIRINPLYLEKRGELTIKREGKKQQTLHVYISRYFDGNPTETVEMGPHMFFPTDKLPFDKMVKGDEQWVPQILKEKFIKGTIWRSSDAEEFLGCEITLM
jgi:ADP-ribose pyrophosphatase YjhB (NUDIX family)